MNEKSNLTVKKVILDKWGSKISYTFDYKDLHELECIINQFENHIEYLNDEKQKLKEQLSNSHQIKNQQKEFIEYLKEPIKMIKEGNPINLSEYTVGKLDTLEEILSKYKEIIGDKE